MAAFTKRSPQTDERATELHRLREQVELQFRRIEALNRFLIETGGAGKVVTVQPATIARLPERRGAVPAIDASSWWPASIWPSQPLVPTPGLPCLSLAGVKLATTAVIVFGLDNQSLEHVVGMISSRQRRSRDFKPVFLTDSTAFRVFRTFGYAFEFLPREVYGAYPNRIRTSVAMRRMRLLQKKWDFASTIDLTRSTDQAELVQAGDPVAAAIGLRDDDGSVRDPDGVASPAPAAERSIAEIVALIKASGLLDEEWYRTQYPEAADSGLDPILHYVTIGAAKGYNPSAVFHTGFYIRQMMRGGSEKA